MDKLDIYFLLDMTSKMVTPFLISIKKAYHILLVMSYIPPTFGCARCPQPGLPFTETSFIRRSEPFTFEFDEIGIALVDVWNFGWKDSPVGKTLSLELSLERGISHIQRKRGIIESVSKIF